LAESADVMKVIIVDKSGKIETKEIDFTQQEILVGRKNPEKPDFQPTFGLEDLRVSRRHAIIRREGNKYFIQVRTSAASMGRL